MKGLQKREPVKNRSQTAKKPFPKASKATVLAAGLALVGVVAISQTVGCKLPSMAADNNQSDRRAMEKNAIADMKTKHVADDQIRTGSLMFGSTTLIDANGAPVVKVVLGSESTPTEAIAAAYIVQKLAANAYASYRLEAQLVGTSTCSVDMDCVIPIIMPFNAQSVIVAKPYAYGYGNLLILDSDAVGVRTIISVGRPQTNSVTSELLMGSEIDWDVDRKVVKEIVQGSKIVVAGATPEDTLSAAGDFIAQMREE